jgi:hypothetical protein
MSYRVRPVVSQSNVSRGQHQGCRIASSAVIRPPGCLLHPPLQPLAGRSNIFFINGAPFACIQMVGPFYDSERSSLGFSCYGRPWTVPPAGPIGPLNQYPVPIRCAAPAPDHGSSGTALAAGAAQRMGLLITSRSAGCKDSPLREEGCTLQFAEGAAFPFGASGPATAAIACTGMEFTGIDRMNRIVAGACRPSILSILSIPVAFLL